MTSRPRVLIVDDEPRVTDALALILEDRGYEVGTAASADEALARLDDLRFDLVITDFKLPGSDGIELLTAIKNIDTETEVILMTAHGSLDVTIEAIKRGAYYYIDKPFTPDQILMLVGRALEFAAVKRENRTLKGTLSKENTAFGMIGRNARMREIYETILATARSDASVLLEGESGTGKELIATAFHRQSDRAERSFIRINCAAIPRDLIESELFGYRRGAFTGADRDKRGLIEAANGGTLLLDEIAEMPVHLQTKLLRVIQDRKVRRLGDEKEFDVDFRLISATNRDTAEAVRDGTLREDLYFRINTIRIPVPPLRERLDDLPLLADAFLARYAAKYGKKISGISQQGFAALVRYGWPGNVRELESVIERAVLFCRGDQIEAHELPDHIAATRARHFRCIIPPFMTLEDVEREAIEQTLERNDGNVMRSAQTLKMHRPTLYRKLKKYGLKGSEARELKRTATG